MKKVVSVCYDMGPAKNVGPVVVALREKGIEVELYADGPAVGYLRASHIDYRHHSSAKELVDAHFKTTPVFYSAVDCNERMPGAEVFRELKRRGLSWPILLQGDFWGTGIYRNEAWFEIKPERFFANDAIDVKLSYHAFPKLEAGDSLALGWPWLDVYADAREIESRAKNLRSKLGLSDQPTVLYAGQLTRSGEITEELVRCLIKAGDPVNLLARIHPAMLSENDNKGKWQAEHDRFSRAIKEFVKWGKGRYFVCNSPYEVRDLIAVSDVVVSAFSTMLLEAAASKKQAIAILYPDVGMAEYLRVSPYTPEFPLVELGCAAKATSDEELVGLLSKAYESELLDDLRPQQMLHFKSDGKNAERVANEIIKLL